MSGARTVDDQVKRDVKRTLQVYLPTVPGPVLDFAASTVFASLTAQSGVAKKASVQGSSAQPPSNFSLRKMESGDWGERSILTSPKARRTKCQLPGLNNHCGASLLDSFDMDFAAGPKGNRAACGKNRPHNSSGAAGAGVGLGAALPCPLRVRPAPTSGSGHC